jgi:hypothetical protein
MSWRQFWNRLLGLWKSRERWRIVRHSPIVPQELDNQAIFCRVVEDLL